jgi:hypothetical protein
VWQPEKKLGKSEKKSGASPEKNLGGCYLLPYIFSSLCPRKSQVAPSKSLFRVQIKGTTVA